MPPFSLSGPRRPSGFRSLGSLSTGLSSARNPWGNHWQVVEYRDVQFTKAARVLEGMGLGALGKSDRALGALRDKGLSD